MSRWCRARDCRCSWDNFQGINKEIAQVQVHLHGGAALLFCILDSWMIEIIICCFPGSHLSYQHTQRFFYSCYSDTCTLKYVQFAKPVKWLFTVRADSEISFDLKSLKMLLLYWVFKWEVITSKVNISWKKINKSCFLVCDCRFQLNLPHIPICI